MHAANHRARASRADHQRWSRFRAARIPLLTAVTLICLGLIAPVLIKAWAAAPGEMAAAASRQNLATPTTPRAKSPALSQALLSSSPWALLGVNAPDPSGERVPAAGQSIPQWVGLGPHCAPDDPYSSTFCFETGTYNSSAPTRTIYTLGNSHSAQIGGALLEAVDRQRGWSLRTQATGGCPFDYVPEPHSPCQQMWRLGTDYILKHQPSLVVVMATRSSVSEPENLLPGLVDWVRMIRSSTTSKVLVVRDSPRFGFNMYECAVKNGWQSEACRVRMPAQQLREHRLELEQAGAIYVDLNHLLCPNGVCQPVVGGTVTYLDDSHVASGIWRTLAFPLSIQLHTRIEWWPSNPYRGKPLPRPATEGVAIV